jgi:TPR repeat protein
MKAFRLGWLLLFLVASATFQLPAQQSQADRKLLADIQRKAEMGDAQYQCLLATALFSGDLGLPKDEEAAVKWFRKAAAQNDDSAQFNLGCCYYQGQGVEQDYTEAVRWFRKSAAQNDDSAQFSLGCCLYQGQGVAQDYAEAVRWFRKSAAQDYSLGQYMLGICYGDGQGVMKDETEAVKWLLKAAEQNLAEAQARLAFCYGTGQGIAKDQAEAVKWLLKAAGQDNAEAQARLGACYASGQGAPRDYVEAAKWLRKAAEQNEVHAQYGLGSCYVNGEGLAKDYVEAYKWLLLAAGQGDEMSKQFLPSLEGLMTREQIEEGQMLSRNFKLRAVMSGRGGPGVLNLRTRPKSSGTGFFITEDGYFITNEHLAGPGARVRLVTEGDLISAKVVKVDAANDLALLKADIIPAPPPGFVLEHGVVTEFSPLRIASSRTARMGSTVATVGFPNIGLQGFAPKLAKGEIAALSGAQDDPRYFQISVPVQPGNSGGALVDERGNVVGVVSAKLSATAALATSGSLPENVNYAVKSSFLLTFLESVPEVSAKLKEPITINQKFEDVVKSAENAAVLVLVY